MLARIFITVELILLYIRLRFGEKIMLKKDILSYVKKEYGTAPEHLWKSAPEYEVLRHEQQPGEKKAKWYGLIMNVKRNTLGLQGEDEIDILNVKCNPEMMGLLQMSKGYLPAYHMNKANWITVLLDGTVPLDNIKQLIDESYYMTASAKERKKKVRSGTKDWIIPANPKYYDVIQAFEEKDIIDWKQSSDIRVGDTIYMYVGAPYSAIMYKCKAVEVDIPYHFEADYLSIKKLMKIQLLCKYGSNFMTFERMKKEFGVYAVRGPRSMPNSLKQELNVYEGEM